MEWGKEAKQALLRVPFFVRNRVRKRVEEEAISQGATSVELRHVGSCRQKFLTDMESDIEGYQVEQCFGPSGCSNRVLKNDDLAARLETIFMRRNLKEFLREKVAGPLRMHHQFRVSISDCPNACSRPQIVDIGIIGCRQPMIDGEICSECGTCVEVCKEQALALEPGGNFPNLARDKCVGCGQCIDVCPTGTLQESLSGYRVLLGGKLGRHPQLGAELPGIYSAQQVLTLVNYCLDHYLNYNLSGERFGEILRRKPLTIDMKGVPCNKQ
ncbi:4Fe-4S binding protein [Desulfoferrobacter suflitae]|uniref:4Fe-4S binding protein n=1 Tax=Desulfoferrobacter suflitae TaxID=2865782 RepID=UPI00216441F5|nr:4Fe-4S binding protein [Desulfoferrobacter suflitae]MCK8603883.1 4Fe-4S binding protein [Desulfoferrobacter suflitae]